jgi:hypothetical protein
MKKRLLAIGVLTFAIAAPVDSHIVQDRASQKCTLTESQPSVETPKPVHPDSMTNKRGEEGSTGLRPDKSCGRQ